MSKLLLQASHLFKSFGSVRIFEDVSLSINDREFFALIGDNGSGKTTLLQMLAGLIPSDSGELNQNAHLSIGFLPQEIMLANQSISVRHFLENRPLKDLEQAMAACLEPPQRLIEWAALHEKYEHLGGYRKIPIEKVLSGLKLENNLLDLPMSVLSSGQRMRAALAKALIENPDLLLLDEPTNHLDHEMLKWLEDTLKQREGACIIVSHDRKFLNAVCNRLVEIKEGKLFYFGGSYDYYLDEQQRQLERKVKEYQTQEEERRFLKQRLKEMSFSKGKAKSPKDRNLMAYDRRGERHQKSLQHRLEAMKARLNEIEANLMPHPIPKNITGLRFAEVQSSLTIDLDQISKDYDHKILFSNLSLKICQGERILITGPNGCGKTTLLKVIAGMTALDKGQIRYGGSTKIAFLDQEAELFPMNKTPLQYFENHYNLSKEDLRREIHKAALGDIELLNRPISTLSTGQRKRIMLFVLTLEKPNVLLLDEPTNHLDLRTLEAFEKALLDFNGIIIAASHDATFIKKIATQQLKLEMYGKDPNHSIFFANP